MLEFTVKHAGQKSSYLDYMSMGTRIKQCRDQRGLTLEEVAKPVGISAQALSQWETGLVKNLRPENFLNFCAFFDVDPYYIVFGAPRSASQTGKFRRLGG